MLCNKRQASFSRRNSANPTVLTPHQSKLFSFCTAANKWQTEWLYEPNSLPGILGYWRLVALDFTLSCFTIKNASKVPNILWCNTYNELNDLEVNHADRCLHDCDINNLHWCYGHCRMCKKPLQRIHYTQMSFKGLFTAICKQYKV